MRSSPELTGDTAAIIRIVEDLPAPLGPRKPNASPRRTSTSMPLTASKSPNDLWRPTAEIIDSVTRLDPTENHRQTPLLYLSSLQEVPVLPGPAAPQSEVVEVALADPAGPWLQPPVGQGQHPVHGALLAL